MKSAKRRSKNVASPEGSRKKATRGALNPVETSSPVRRTKKKFGGKNKRIDKGKGKAVEEDMGPSDRRTGNARESRRRDRQPSAEPESQMEIATSRSTRATPPPAPAPKNTDFAGSGPSRATPPPAPAPKKADLVGSGLWHHNVLPLLLLQLWWMFGRILRPFPTLRLVLLLSPSR